MFRGSPDRNGSIAGGMPIPKLEWALESSLFPDDEARVKRMQKAFLDEEIAAIPSMQPVAVGNQLLMRTARLMLGVDLSTGRRSLALP